MPPRDAGPPAIQMRASGKELRQISRELRAQNSKTIVRQFRRELRAAAAPFVPAVRRSIDQIPVKGTSGSTGLRAAMKKATTLSVRTVGKQAQVSISVTGRKMPDEQRRLPSYMEGTRPRWRHPVYGHDVYVQQPAHPYFYRVVRPMGAAAKVAVNKVVIDITRKIT